MGMPAERAGALVPSAAEPRVPKAGMGLPAERGGAELPSAEKLAVLPRLGRLTGILTLPVFTALTALFTTDGGSIGLPLYVTPPPLNVTPPTVKLLTAGRNPAAGVRLATLNPVAAPTVAGVITRYCGPGAGLGGSRCWEFVDTATAVEFVPCGDL
jgi:hypothetical protein